MFFSRRVTASHKVLVMLAEHMDVRISSTSSRGVLLMAIAKAICAHDEPDVREQFVRTASKLDQKSTPSMYVDPATECCWDELDPDDKNEYPELKKRFDQLTRARKVSQWKSARTKGARTPVKRKAGSGVVAVSGQKRKRPRRTARPPSPVAVPGGRPQKCNHSDRHNLRMRETFACISTYHVPTQSSIMWNAVTLIEAFAIACCLSLPYSIHIVMRMCLIL